MLTEPFAWRQLLGVAEFHCQSHAAIPEEAALRAAVSRAYYAAYWVARELLEQQGATFERFGAHGDVRAALRRLATQQAEAGDAERLLTCLREARETADYERAAPMTPKSAAEACDWARTAIRLLDRVAAAGAERT